LNRKFKGQRRRRRDLVSCHPKVWRHTKLPSERKSKKREDRVI